MIYMCAIEGEAPSGISYGKIFERIEGKGTYDDVFR